MLPSDISEKVGSLVGARTGEAAYSQPLKLNLFSVGQTALAMFCNPVSKSVMHEISWFAGKVSLCLGGEN